MARNEKKEKAEAAIELEVDTENKKKGKKKHYKFHAGVSAGLSNFFKKIFTKKTLPWIITAVVTTTSAGVGGKYYLFDKYKPEPEKCVPANIIRKSEGVRFLHYTLTYIGRDNGIYSIIVRDKSNNSTMGFGMKVGESIRISDKEGMIVIKNCGVVDNLLKISVKLFIKIKKANNEKVLKQRIMTFPLNISSTDNRSEQ